jgi:DNA polymerase III epsilon subunit-like protein
MTTVSSWKSIWWYVVVRHLLLYNKVIKHRLQDGQWIDYATDRSGITEADYHNGIPYEEVIVEVKDILKDAIVAGHNTRCDFS